MTKRVIGLCTQDMYALDYPDANFLLTLHRSGFKLTDVPIEVKPRAGGGIAASWVKKIGS